MKQRTKILNVLAIIQTGACISDYALFSATFMFDKMMEGLSIKNPNSQYLQNEEFKIGVVCLYLAAKFEDQKYPFFNCYRRIVLEKT